MVLVMVNCRINRIHLSVSFCRPRWWGYCFPRRNRVYFSSFSHSENPEEWSVVSSIEYMSFSHQKTRFLRGKKHSHHLGWQRETDKCILFILPFTITEINRDTDVVKMSLNVKSVRSFWLRDLIDIGSLPSLISIFFRVDQFDFNSFTDRGIREFGSSSGTSVRFKSRLETGSNWICCIPNDEHSENIFRIMINLCKSWWWSWSV